MLHKLNFLMLFLCLLFLGSLATPVSAVPDSANASLILVEVKVRNVLSSQSGYDEYVEIYNASFQPINLTGYYFEYYNAAYPAPDQVPVQKAISSNVLGTGSSLVLAKDANLASIPNAIKNPLSSLSDTGGRLRIINSGGIILDEIAWASTKDPQPPVQYLCTAQSCDTYRNYSFSRMTAANGAYLYSDAAWQLAPASPVSSAFAPAVVSSQNAQTPAAISQNSPTTATANCDGVVISEILPNPSGTDTGKEYIELHNPTGSVISLSGCSLKSSANTKTYVFPTGTYLGSGQSYAFYDSQTGITLTNTSGGTVWLLDNTHELQSVTYPGGLDSDVTWALNGSHWSASYTASPGTANTVNSTKPCSSGQTRSQDTNRCQSVASLAASALSPCKVGQERNPDTNRCRSVLGTVVGLVPCKAGQTRNSDTNRCRSAASTASVLKPCKAGEERNPQTNRCRKATQSGNETSELATVKDVSSASPTGNPKWWIAGIAAMGAVGYGGYEWRQDLFTKFKALKKKYFRG